MHCAVRRTLIGLRGIRAAQIPARTYAQGYLASKVEESPDKYTSVEKSFSEWKYVEKLLPPATIPEPPKWDQPAPSGWRSQNLEAVKSYPYFIRRTKNHMIPVYLMQNYRGMRKITRIKNVEGNIWRLEEEVGKFLKRKYPDKGIATYVHECARYVSVHGDYEADLKEWIIKRGF